MLRARVLAPCLVSLSLSFVGVAYAADPPHKSGPATSQKAETSTSEASPEKEGQRQRWIGARSRAVYIPQFMFGVFQADGGKSIVSPSVGLELATRHKDFEVDTWISYSSIAMGDVALKSKSDPNSAYEIVNSSMKMLSVGADFLWSTAMNEQLAFTYGGGVGLGLVFGDLKRNQAYSTGDPNDPSSYTKCPAPSYSAACGTDNNHYGNYSESNWINGGSKPVIFPWIALPQIGLRYQPSPKFAARLDTGLSFPGPFFVGLSGYYRLL